LYGWIDSEDPQQDIGGVVLNTRGGNTISHRVGALGFAWYQSYVQHFQVIGYPVARPFNGKRMVTCQASLSVVLGDVNPMSGVGCDMTGGSSGGPFIIEYRTGTYLNGNVSIRLLDAPGELYSPYFGDCAYWMYEALTTSTPDSPAEEFTCTIP
jgi:hypothetical protein